MKKNTKISSSRFLLISLISLLASLLSACENKSESGEGLSGRIEIDGSSTVYPLTEAVLEEFRSEERDVMITLGNSGTGAGMKKFCRGNIDIVNASRPMKDSEKQNCNGADIEFQELTVGLDGIAIVVHPGNDWIHEITMGDLKKLWKPKSGIQTWSDLDPGWPDEQIRLFGPNTAHGTYDFFTEEVMGESGASRSDYNAVADYNVAVQGISTDEYALGYFGLAYYEENKEKLKLLGVDAGEGMVIPSVETVMDGSYVLSRPLYIYVTAESAAKKHVQAFIHFYLDDAPELTKVVGYIPLQQKKYTAQKKEFNAFAGMEAINDTVPGTNE